MTSTERLTEELRRQAQALPDQHPLTLADIQGRARGIRRRRYAASGLAAAAVLAVTVPLGLAAGDRLDRTSPGPVDRPSEGRSVIEDGLPTPDADVDPSPAPELPRRVALTTDTRTVGSPPQLPYLSGRELVLPDGPVAAVDGSYDVLLPLGDGFVVGGDAGDGRRFAALLDASGEESDRFAAQGWPGIAADGSLAAYAQPGEALVVTLDSSGKRDGVSLPDSLAGEPPITVTGVHPCSAFEDCLLVADVESDGGARTLQVDRDGTQRETRFLQLADRSVDGTLAGRVPSDDPGAVCSAVTSPGANGWETCTWQLGQFSPDGRFVLGYPLEDGRGPRSVALLDARDGTVLREYAARGRSDVFVRQAVWDTDGSVLATVWDTDHWAVLRMTVEGLISGVPVEGLDGADDPDAPPVFLAGGS